MKERDLSKLCFVHLLMNIRRVEGYTVHHDV